MAKLLSPKASNFLGMAACAVLACLSLGIAIHQARVLSPLLEDGIRTEAVIVDFHVNVKAGKKPILAFTTVSGKEVQQRDLFPMMLFRFQQGDHVKIVYDVRDPAIVTIDLGVWTWQQTVVLYFGFLLLAGLFIALPRLQSKDQNQ